MWCLHLNSVGMVSKVPERRPYIEIQGVIDGSEPPSLSLRAVLGLGIGSHENYQNRRSFDFMNVEEALSCGYSTREKESIPI